MRLHAPALHHGSVCVPAPDDGCTQEQIELIEEAWTHVDEARLCLKKLDLLDDPKSEIAVKVAWLLSWIEDVTEEMRSL